MSPSSTPSHDDRGLTEATVRAMLPRVSPLNAFATWFRQRQADLYLNNLQLARATGFDAAVISRMRGGAAPRSMKGCTRLARAFGVPVEEVIRFGGGHRKLLAQTAPSPEPLGSIRILADGIPDHALVHLAAELGYLQEERLQIAPAYDTSGLPLNYPERQMAFLKAALDDEQPAVVVMQEKDAETGVKTLETEVPRTLIPSHKYHGYAVITRANTEQLLPSVHLVPSHHKHETFLHLFRLLENRGIVDNEYAPPQGRVAWYGPAEKDFWQAAISLYRGLTGSPPLEQKAGGAGSAPAVDLLLELDEPGTRGRDLVIGDAYHLSVALRDKKKYRVLLSFSDIFNGVLATEAERSLASCRQYYIERGPRTPAIFEKFLALWRTTFEGFQGQVSWHLVDSDLDRRERLAHAITNVRDKTLQFLTAPATRHEGLRRLRDIVKVMRAADDPHTLDLADFANAWTMSFSE